MIELGRSEIETFNGKKDPFSYVSKLLMFVQRTGDDEKRLRHHLEFVLVRLRRNVIKADISKIVLQKDTSIVADIAYDIGKHIRSSFAYSDTKQHNACAELVELWESPLKFDAKLPQGDHAARKVLAASTNTCKRIVDMCESSIDGELDGTYKEISANYRKDATAAEKFNYCKLGTSGMQQDYEKESLEQCQKTYLPLPRARLSRYPRSQMLRFRWWWFPLQTTKKLRSQRTGHGTHSAVHQKCAILPSVLAPSRNGS